VTNAPRRYRAGVRIPVSGTIDTGAADHHTSEAIMSDLQTIRHIVGLPDDAPPISESALVIIDAQNTYREGVMKLDGVEDALSECRAILERFRAAGRPVFHIRHDAGPGSPYDVNDHIGQIADIVAPKDGEPVITKNYPNSFVGTELDELLKAQGVENLILVGFMTHMCVNSTARGAFSLGYRPVVAASATATRALPSSVSGDDIPSGAVHDAALAAMADLVAAVVPRTSDVPD
jgi:nicotinamidase-related amidase